MTKYQVRHLPTGADVGEPHVTMTDAILAIVLLTATTPDAENDYRVVPVLAEVTP